MCQKCEDIFKKCFPDVTDEEFEYILWNETPYPFGTHEDFERAIKEACLEYGLVGFA